MKLRYHNRRGAGTTEYIVIILIVLALLLTLFWSSIQPVLVEKLDEINFLLSGKKKERHEKEKKTGDKESGEETSETMLDDNEEITYGNTPVGSSGTIKNP